MEEFDFETPITESITLVAKWDRIIVEVNKFIVTLITVMMISPMIILL